MPQILVRDLDPTVIKKLKSRARHHHRSLQAELKDVLEQAAAMNVTDIRGRVKRIRAMFEGRAFGDSSALIRRDRAR